MPPIPQVYRAIVANNQGELNRLVRSAGVARVRRMYEEIVEDITRQLSTSGGTFDHVRLKGMLAQVRVGLARLQRASGLAVDEARAEVGVSSARSLLQGLARLEHHFTGAVIPMPLLEVARLRGLVEDRTSSLMRVHESTMRRFGARMVSEVEVSLASSLALGETQTQAIDRVVEVGDVAWPRAERIVRTELAFAANAAARGAADEQAAELDGDMWSRWSEHVSDDGSPLDDRVGADSEALHGQVAPPGGMFTQPPRSPKGTEVGQLAGQQWACPPNRPNDRAVLTPWRVGWGVRGWRWDGQRVPVTAEYAARINARWVRARSRPVDAAPPDETEQ